MIFDGGSTRGISIPWSSRLTDMQGRLQGKRLHAAYFAEHVLDHGAEGPAHLLAVDVDMNIGDRYAISTADKTDGDIRLVPDMQTIRLLRHEPGTVMVQCDAVWPDQTPVAQSPRTILKHQLAAAANRDYVVAAGTACSSWHSTPATRTPGLLIIVILLWSTSTTSTTRSWAAVGSNRCCARSATRPTPQGSMSHRSPVGATWDSMRSASAMPKP